MFIPVIKAVFSASLIQSSVSHDHSEIMMLKKHLLLLLSMLKTVLLHSFFQDSLMNRKFKRTAFIWNTKYFATL